MTEASQAQDRRPSGIDREQAIRANIVVHTKMSESYNENEPHFRPENKAIVRSILEDLAHKKLGGGTVIGPILEGLSKPVQIVPIGSTVSDVVNMAAIAAHDAVDGSLF